MTSPKKCNKYKEFLITYFFTSIVIMKLFRERDTHSKGKIHENLSKNKKKSS